MANDAELLADLLDGRLDPAAAPSELAELAELAGAVSEHITLVPPTPAFRASLREELLEAVGGPGAGPSAGGGAGGGGGATSAGTGTAGATYAATGIPAVVAALAAAAVLVSGTHAVTTASVPGDPLYGLKQGVESLQLGIADSERDVELLVGFAIERLREAIGLEDPAVVSELLDESRRLLDDALALAAAQGRPVEELLAGYASALVTLDSRTDDPVVSAQLDQLRDDVGLTPSPGPLDPLVPGDGADEQGADEGGTGTDPDTGSDASDGPEDEPSEDAPDGTLDDPLDDLDDPLDDLDDPLDDLDDPLDELDDTVDDTLDGLGR